MAEYITAVWTVLRNPERYYVHFLFSSVVVVVVVFVVVVVVLFFVCLFFVCLFFVLFLYITRKRGLPRKCARFVLFRLIKKRSFNLLCVLDLISDLNCNIPTLW